MALVTHDWCGKCERTTQRVNGKCVECAAKEEQARIIVWNAQTTEEKLQDLRRRVERLEAKPPTYQSETCHPDSSAAL